MLMMLARWIFVGVLLLLARHLSLIAASLPDSSAPTIVPDDRVSSKSWTEPRDACQSAKPAVVTIYAGREIGAGSIIDADGIVITSHHVVRGARQIWVKLLDGDRHRGQIIAADTENDLALVHLDAGARLPTLPLAHSVTQPSNESVCAIGSPLNQPGVVTTGTVMGTRENGDWQLNLFLQPGNSGGPLLNQQGELIGVARSIWESSTGENTGISFATSLASVRRFVQQHQLNVRRDRDSTHAVQPLSLFNSLPATDGFNAQRFLNQADSNSRSKQ
ncbi:trypsin-like peptidase domain-containing protein [Leptolyngbya sp. FACHB-36]|uniref:S1C family serine protease n=1 Tax=Leptolyngbya sp. FACHB-36 TaxID=2692808 RepID=UPI00167FF554|nr:trypsin-like peptidase domain-containing protein [Leptolyngbya sp. FACHB-36]MBD2021527.1 trypsin-like peptidase domain-containing protein [Leptolyngbya sp. FACHB-36]